MIAILCDRCRVRLDKQPFKQVKFETINNPHVSYYEESSVEEDMHLCLKCYRELKDFISTYNCVRDTLSKGEQN